MQQNNFFQNLRAVFPSEREAQLNRLNIPNKVELGGGKSLEADDIKYIVDNTYQQNTDGTSYGVGKDGRPYSYRLNGAKVDNVTSLDMEKQKELIKMFTNGEITISDSIANPESLSWVLQVAKKMRDYSNGNLIPRNLLVSDIDSDRALEEYEDGIEGVHQYGDPRRNKSDVLLRHSNDPELIKDMIYQAAESGWWASDDPSAITAHEFSHAAEEGTDSSLNWLAKQLDKNSNKLDKKIYRYPYSNFPFLRAIPFEGNKTVEDNIYSTYNRKKRKADKELRSKGFESTDDILNIAARNLGYENSDEVRDEISGYAAGNNSSEVFAEAYADVLLNGNNAHPYSKELVSLMSQKADIVSRHFGMDNKRAAQLISKAKSQLPSLNTAAENFDRFKNNWKLAK